MRNIFLIVFISVLPFLYSCSQRGGDNSDEAKNIKGEINLITSDELYNIAATWSDKFTKKYTGVTMHVEKSDKPDVSINNKNNCLLLSLKDYTDKDFYKIKVANDIIVFIFNNGNAEIQKIAFEGITPYEIKRTYTENKDFLWSDFFGSEKNNKEKIITYKLNDEDAATAAIHNLFKIKQDEKLKGNAVVNEMEMLSSIRNDVFGVGYCSFNVAYASAGNMKSVGIYVLPLDINADGIVDDREQVYDRKDILIKAFQKGQYPSELSRKVCLFSSSKPTDEAVVAFLKWVLGEGQNYLEEKGLVPLTQKEISESKKDL